MNRWHWLELAEPMSLVGSVAGSIVATVSGQVVYAVTPVALTLSFNWVNRHRLQQLQTQQLQQYTINIITEVDQRTQALLASSETQIKELIQQQFTVLSHNLQKENEQTQQLDLITKSLNSLSNDYNNRPELQDINLLREQLTTLEFQINNKALVTKQEVNTLSVQLTKVIKEEIASFPIPPQPFEPSSLLEQIEKLNTQTIAEIQLQLTQLQELVERVDKNSESVHEGIRNLEPSKIIKQELDNVTQVFTELVEEIVNKSVINHNQPVYQYDLVIDRSESRKVLIEALSKAKKQLILVSPWLIQNCLDAHNNEICNLCKQFLEQGGILKIGYGKWLDIKKERINGNKSYNALDYFKDLAKKYPNRCQIKLLGTNENLIICDQKFAMFSSFNFLRVTDINPERELGLRTNNPTIIDKLIKRFENASNLELNNRNRHRPTPYSSILSNQCRFCSRSPVPGSDLCFSCS